MYSPVSTVRKTGSYIYEEFMPTDGTDVKVYYVTDILFLTHMQCNVSLCNGDSVAGRPAW